MTIHKHNDYNNDNKIKLQQMRLAFKHFIKIILGQILRKIDYFFFFNSEYLLTYICITKI